MRISLICPVHNEENNLKGLFESIKKQTKSPEEIIFVEDSSTDKTIGVLKDFQKERENIKIFRVKNKNISKNRNLAIKSSKNKIIVCIDAGCSMDKNYLKKIYSAFNDKKIKFVGGVSKLKPKNLFDKCFADFVEKKKITSNYLPKGHAMAFRKELWEKIGGFPEYLALGAEDTYFGKEAIKRGYPPKIITGAVVYWENRKNLKEIFKQFKNYGYWDAKAFSLKGLPRNSKLNILISIIFPLSFLHAFYKGICLMIKFKNLKAFYYGFMINLAKIYGYFFGLVKGELK